jgi:hypothetical protein
MDTNRTTEAVSDDRLRNTRAWAAVRVGSLSGAEVIVAACDEALAARSSPEPAPAVATEGSDKLLHITGAWSGRHVWTIGRMEFVELRDVLDVMRTPSPEPAEQPLADDEGMVAVVAQCLCLKDGGDPHRLLHSGFPPEPWGEEWCRYEREARGYLRDLDQQEASRVAAQSPTKSAEQTVCGHLRTDLMHFLEPSAVGVREQHKCCDCGQLITVQTSRQPLNGSERGS